MPMLWLPPAQPGNRHIQNITVAKLIFTLVFFQPACRFYEIKILLLLNCQRHSKIAFLMFLFAYLMQKKWQLAYTLWQHNISI